MSPVIRTARADEDLVDIWTTIAADTPGAADRVLDAIGRRWQQLAQHPRSGLAREEIAPGIRHLIVGQYLTLYCIKDEGIEIVCVRHGRRRMNCNAME